MRASSSARHQLFFLTIFLLLFAFSWGGGSGGQGEDRLGRKIKVVPFEHFQRELAEKDSSRLLIVNFWATWCRPCREEIPQIRAVYEAYKKKGVKMVLVSVDPVEELKKLRKFVRKNKLRMEHYLLDEVDFRSAIKGMDPDWTGEIPTTFFIKDGVQQDFHVGFFPKRELFEAVREKLEQPSGSTSTTRNHE